jgi:hypothetical protein
MRKHAFSNSGADDALALLFSQPLAHELLEQRLIALATPDRRPPPLRTQH